jgi:lipopolysaccharide transport system ATP-binding protein
MSNLAIKVENLSKIYKIGARRNRHDTLRDHLVDGVKSLFSRNGHVSAVGGQSPNGDYIWALKDISFEVKHGEAVGFIGKNGAGKSTLLKILSRITEPSRGRGEIFGRVGSLLEVGTGFHPELTGRENIYLNGAILGMKRWEINKNFDEIVAFSEIEKFIDTPVKRYSSGMYVRLAFAVAAHLDPEILIVDEVLAVGDAQFQKKCLGKMDDVTKEGRTVLFVSHNLTAIRRLCNRGLLLNQGEKVCYDSIETCVARYGQGFLNGGRKTSAPHILYETPNGTAKSQFQITGIEILDPEGNPKDRVYTWDSFILRVRYEAQTRVSKGSVAILISSVEGAPLVLLSTEPDSAVPMTIEYGKHEVDCLIKKIPLSAGDFLIGAALALPNQEWLVKKESLGRMTIYPRDVFGSGLPPTSTRALMAVPHDWHIK